MALEGALLAFMIKEKFIKFEPPDFLKVELLLPTIFFSGFGLLLCLYSIIATMSGINHITSNWKNADHSLGLDVKVIGFLKKVTKFPGFMCKSQRPSRQPALSGW